MAAIDASIYEEVIIESADRSTTVDIRLGIVSIDYYEDIFSPTITAKIVIADTASNGLDGLYKGLKIQGGERVSLKIAGNSSDNKGLDFASSVDDYFYVSGVSNAILQGNREVFTLNLFSRESITNETSRVPIKFPKSRIDISATKIIKEYLLTNKPIDVDQTANVYGFIGNMRKPFTLLTMLAAKASPHDGAAGYLFYQTQEGYKFKSIDKMISAKPVAEYLYNEVADFNSTLNDYKISDYSWDMNQSLIETLRLGTYSSFKGSFNPLTHRFTSYFEGVSDFESGRVNNLGAEFSSSKISDSTNKNILEIPSRYMTFVLDIGTIDDGISKEENGEDYRSESIRRYNLLFAQQVSMTIPLNTNLKAGDIIKCLFPNMTTSNAKEYDDFQSGLYMIKELCHHFDSNMSLTSMKLVRDTYGQHSVNNKNI